MPNAPDPRFQFALGQHVRWAGDPTHRYQIGQRRWTERIVLGPVVEYYLCWRAPHGPDAGWVSEADLTRWQEPHEKVVEIGDLSVESTAEGRRLRLTIAEQQPTTTLSVEGATVLVNYLYDWLWSHAEAPEDTTGPSHVSQEAP
jgi:hypothetical protein